MLRFTKLSACLLAATVFYVTPAHAQATRTWVSGVGDDANPCSRTAPCKTFAGAISKTATGGEINCLDPGGFGGVTITKALSIVCDYTEGGILSAGAGVNGIIINAPATSHVYLSGLDLHGAGNAQNGIRFIAGASLTVENTVIRAYNASGGLGISFQPSGSSSLNLRNVTVSNNGNAATGGGILIQPTGAGGAARVSMVNVRAFANSNTALRIDSTGNSNATGITVDIDGSSFNNNSNGIAVVNAAGTNPIGVLIANSTINNNNGTALITNGTNALVRVGGSTITGNVTGVLAAGGSSIRSFGTNHLNGNPTVGAVNDGTFTPPIIPPQ